MTFEDWMRANTTCALDTVCGVYRSYETDLACRAWQSAIAAERDRLRQLVEARMPLMAVYDDQRAVANTLRWVLDQLGDA